MKFQKLDLNDYLLDVLYEECQSCDSSFIDIQKRQEYEIPLHETSDMFLILSGDAQIVKNTEFDLIDYSSSDCTQSDREELTVPEPP